MRKLTKILPAQSILAILITSFLRRGFPNRLALSQVELRTVCGLYVNAAQAEQIEVRVNVLGLLSNEINIDKIEIQQATLHLFKGKNRCKHRYFLGP
jgi:uncharacterized protein involved in outer membrane biogenesis